MDGRSWEKFSIGKTRRNEAGALMYDVRCMMYDIGHTMPSDF